MDMAVEENQKSEGADASNEESNSNESGSEEEPQVASLEESLKKEKEQAERYLANWQRVQADLVNYKKRVEQERSESAKYASWAPISSLLQVLDDFDRALRSMPANLMGLTWIEGVFLMQKKLQTILEGQGLSEITALGEDFDPNLHEAVMYGEGEEGKVVVELQKGYMLHDRVLRPSMVQVGQGTSSQNETTGTEGAEETDGGPIDSQPGSSD